MRAIPNNGLRPAVRKTSYCRTGTTSLFDNDRPQGGLLQGIRYVLERFGLQRLIESLTELLHADDPDA